MTRTTGPKDPQTAHAKSAKNIKSVKNAKNRQKSRSPWLVIILLLLAALIGLIYYLIAHPGAVIFRPVRPTSPEPIYSTLTGDQIADPADDHAPTYCVQIPNGLDGARPQVGLGDAAVIFEAIAEAGITRFAAVYQNPTTAFIGPIRSIRPYYLDWDAPFDCTVVHIGGSDEALANIAWSGQRHLDYDPNYFWAEDPTDRLWNNYFTSPERLAAYSQAAGITTGNFTAFPRLTPDELTAELDTPASVTSITVNFGYSPSFDPVFTYDPAHNDYTRSYRDGSPHLAHSCPADTPEQAIESCQLIPLAPRVVAIIHVNEHLAADGYHEQITTIGSGQAEIFQNGTVISGRWSKPSKDAQITFTDQGGEPVALTPGQLWIVALPGYGTLTWN